MMFGLEPCFLFNPKEVDWLDLLKTRRLRNVFHKICTKTKARPFCKDNVCAVWINVIWHHFHVGLVIF